ncbi:MAG: hypothetical protein ACREAC_08690, partial [Blastocatellia bacterium]
MATNRAKSHGGSYWTHEIARVVLVTAAVLFAGLSVLGLPGHRVSAARSADGPFTMEQVLSYPFTLELVAAPGGERIAWVMNERGVRNIWTAEGPGFKAHQLTSYKDDDG